MTQLERVSIATMTGGRWLFSYGVSSIGTIGCVRRRQLWHTWTTMVNQGARIGRYVAAGQALGGRGVPRCGWQVRDRLAVHRDWVGWVHA